MTELPRNRLVLAVVFGGVAALAGVSGFYWSRGTISGARQDTVAALHGLALPDAAGKLQSLAQWDNKVLIINFWATWCAPCREEMPILHKIGQRYASNGVQVVGIAVDSIQNVADFLKNIKVGYPLLIGGIDAIDLARKLGNKSGALPYTLVLDRNGRLLTTRLGALSEAELEILIRPVLTKSEGAN